MEVFGDASRSNASSGGFSPRQMPGFRFTWSPRLLLLELFASVRVQAVAASAAPPVLFILRLPGFLGDCGFADVDGGFGSGF